jgi:hypothetical protein
MQSIQYFLKLIKLTYITFPFYKEDNPNTARNSWNLYLAAFFFPIAGGIFSDAFNSFNYHYPNFNELHITHGVVIRDERTKGGGRNVSELFKIKTPTAGEFTFICTTSGGKCFEDSEWDGYVNQPATVWSSDGYAMQIQINQQIPKMRDYQFLKKARTSKQFPMFFFLASPFIIWALRRSWRLYAHKAKALIASSFS